MNIKNNIKLPFNISIIVLIIIMLLWFFPSLLGLVNEQYKLQAFRSDLKDLASLIYIVITLWLVLETRKMVIVSINSQKASNRPEIQCQLYFMRNKPSKENIENVKNLEIISSIKAEYFEDQVGVNIFILVKNRYGGGKSINIKISAEFEIQNPDVSIINRDYKLDYLDTGDAVALYVTKFENPSESTSIKLNKCFVEFTDPFMEASKEKKYTLLYDKTNQIVAKGDDINEINISEGIRT